MASVEVKEWQWSEAERENEAGGVGSLGSGTEMCTGRPEAGVDRRGQCLRGTLGCTRDAGVNSEFAFLRPCLASRAQSREQGALEEEHGEQSRTRAREGGVRGIVTVLMVSILSGMRGRRRQQG